MQMVTEGKHQWEDFCSNIYFSAVGIILWSDLHHQLKFTLWHGDMIGVVKFLQGKKLRGSN